MNRKKINFPEELLAKLEKRREQKGFNALSPCVVEMLEWMFEMEDKGALPAKNSSLKSSTQISPELTELLAIKRMLINSSAWIMESRLLNRYLVEKMPNQSQETGLKILKRFKERASDFIVKMMTARVFKQEDTDPEKEGILLLEKAEKIR